MDLRKDHKIARVPHTGIGGPGSAEIESKAMNTLISRIVSIGLLSIVSIPVTVSADGVCPAFNASMVDAAFMAIEFSQDVPLEGNATDSPTEGVTFCNLITDSGSSLFIFVGNGEAQVIGNGPTGTLLRSAVFDISLTEQRACRAQVLQSFAWKQHCVPFLSD